MNWYNSLGENSRAWAMFCVVCCVLAALVMGSLTLDRCTGPAETVRIVEVQKPHNHKVNGEAK